MSTKTKKSTPTGKRYTATEKQAVVDYVNQVNAENGRGGQAAAAKKFGISVLTVSSWLKAAGVVKAPSAAKVAPVAKPAAVTKVTKPAKAAKAAKAAPAAKAPAKKATRKVPQGTRYTDEEKKAVMDFVASVNAKQGRGGMTAAAKKFKITPLTVSTWVRKFGVAGTTVASTGKSAGASAKVVVKLRSQVAKAEATLSKVKALLASL